MLNEQVWRNITAPFNNMRTRKFKDQPRNAFFATVKSNVRRLFPASDHCRGRGNQIVERISNNDKELSSSRRLGGAAEHLIDGSEKTFVG